MKKLLILCASLLLITGCSDANANVSNPTESLITVGDHSYTKGEMYNFMMSQGPDYFVISQAQEIIANAQVEVTDEILATVDETIESYKQMLGDSLVMYINQMGYEDEEAFKEALILNEQMIIITETKVTEKFEEYSATYAPRQIQIATFASQEDANSALASMNEGTSFADAAKEFKSTVGTDTLTITNQDAYPTNVLFAINSLEKDTLSEVVAGDDEKSFYIVKMINNDPNEFTEAAVEKIAQLETIVNSTITTLFEDFNFAVYDKRLHDAVSTNFPDLLK